MILNFTERFIEIFFSISILLSFKRLTSILRKLMKVNRSCDLWTERLTCLSSLHLHHLSLITLGSYLRRTTIEKLPSSRQLWWVKAKCIANLTEEFPVSKYLPDNEPTSFLRIGEGFPSCCWDPMSIQKGFGKTGVGCQLGCFCRWTETPNSCCSQVINNP